MLGLYLIAPPATTDAPPAALDAPLLPQDVAPDEEQFLPPVPEHGAVQAAVRVSFENYLEHNARYLVISGLGMPASNSARFWSHERSLSLSNDGTASFRTSSRYTSRVPNRPLAMVRT